MPLALWAGAERWTGPTVLPQEWGLGGVRRAVASGGTGAFVRSAILGLLVAGAAIPVGALAGFARPAAGPGFRG